MIRKPTKMSSKYMFSLKWSIMQYFMILLHFEICKIRSAYIWVRDIWVCAMWSLLMHGVWVCVQVCVCRFSVVMVLMWRACHNILDVVVSPFNVNMDLCVCPFWIDRSASIWHANEDYDHKRKLVTIPAYLVSCHYLFTTEITNHSTATHFTAKQSIRYCFDPHYGSASLEKILLLSDVVCVSCSQTHTVCMRICVSKQIVLDSKPTDT